MAVIIGSARIDEFGKLAGGAAGDQKQWTKDDYVGEVSMQHMYVHPKGWYVLRPKSIAVANKMASRMRSACNNSNLGYDQGNRLGVIKDGTDSKKKTETDCSTLVRAIIKEVTGKDPGNFTTANEVKALTDTGLFQKCIVYKSGMTLYPGDVLVTQTKGHTAIVVQGSIRQEEAKPEPAKTTKYRVTAHSGLWIREGASTGAKKIIAMPYEALFVSTKTSNGWARGTWQGYTGWSSLKYLRKV